MYPKLNLPKTNLKLKGDTVWDILRKKYVLNTPEEWVRQHYIHYMVNILKYPNSLMASERLVKYNGLSKRCDIVAYSNQLKPILIVECKSPKIKLTEDTFYQVAKYNFTLKAPLLVLTNGLQHNAAHIDTNTNKVNFLAEMPSFEENLKLSCDF
jgi:hypothetical protein